MKYNNPFYRMLMLLLAVVLATAGWYLSQTGFNNIQSLRQIERISNTSISAALSGEVKLNATVQKDKKLLSSEYFGRNSIYYAYRYEIETTDSDGDTSWSTQFEHSDSVDFLLTDNTGEIRVNLPRHNSDLKYSLPIADQVIVGSSRHTEWRIEPGDNVFVLAMLASDELNFVQKGHYLPIISKYGENHEKSDIGIKLVLLIAGGISLIAFAVFSLICALQIHRIIVFIFVLSLSIIVPLVHLGVSMIHQDIVTGEKRLSLQTRAALSTINQKLNSYSQQNLTWHQLTPYLLESNNQLPVELSKIINEIQINTAYQQRIYQDQLANFPNNFMSWFYLVEPRDVAQYLTESQLNQLDDRLKQFEKAETAGLLPVIISILGFIACIGFTLFGFSLIRLKRHIENIPTSKSTGLVFGLAELKGRISKIDQEKPLISPLTSSHCYWFHYTVEESRGSGKEQRWVTIENTKSHQKFNCKDAYGEVKVSPKHAEIISLHHKTKRIGKLRYSERILRLNDKVYVLGNAKIDKSHQDTLEIRGKKGEKPFLITNFSEQVIMMKKANNGMLSLTTAFSSLMFACLFYLGIHGSFSPADYLIVAFIAPIYMSFVILVLHYNDLIFLKQRASRNRSNINVSMQKRHELIPNIEKIVKKYMAHENELLEEITNLRSNYKQSGSRDLTTIGAQLENEQLVLANIIAKVEENPKLKTVGLNKKLMSRLIDLENEVALMREGYNDSVTYYNTRISTLPDVFFARLFGFKPMKLFEYRERKFSKVDIDWNLDSTASSV
jgi:hypothetical protein